MILLVSKKITVDKLTNVCYSVGVNKGKEFANGKTLQ